VNVIRYSFLVAVVALLCSSAGRCGTLHEAATSSDSFSTIGSSSPNSSARASTAADEEEFEPLYPMSAERKARLIEYSRFRNIWRFVGFGVGIAIPALILLTGFSAGMRDWAKVARSRFFVIWLYFVFFTVAAYVLEFPFNVYRGFVVESDFGFMNQTFGQWFSEDLLSLLIQLVIGVIPVLLFYFLVSRIRRWWLAFSVGAVPLIVLGIVIAPVVISPMFNKFEPLKNPELEADVRTLASKAGIEGADIFQVNSSKQSAKINAYVTGLFGSKRIVLYDTMIDNFTTDEIKFVMGHEMGHYVMHHIWWGVLVVAVFLAFSLWLTDKTIHKVIRVFKNRFKFESLSDIASLPLVLIFVSVILFIFQPVTNGVSRMMERQADRYGMEISGVSGETAAMAFDKLSVFNLHDPDPHPVIEFWFYDHPALKKRMEFVRSLRP
jgi:Zn-dependent protease with chaperone function